MKSEERGVKSEEVRVSWALERGIFASEKQKRRRAWTVPLAFFFAVKCKFLFVKLGKNSENKGQNA
ncbi:MAG: hypothetical protein J6Q85_03130 [Clostridia bacterium]|nr:hypothetical protein [Clostridia bacterium]